MAGRTALLVASMLAILAAGAAEAQTTSTSTTSTTLVNPCAGQPCTTEPPVAVLSAPAGS